MVACDDSMVIRPPVFRLGYVLEHNRFLFYPLVPSPVSLKDSGVCIRGTAEGV